MDIQLVRLKDWKFATEQLNTRIALCAMVKKSELKPQRNGGSYLLLEIVDSGVTEVVKLWGATQEHADELKAGCVMNLAVDIKPYAAAPQGYSLILGKYQLSDVPATEFVEWAPNINSTIQDVLNGLNSLAGTVYHQLATELLKANWDTFIKLPAGRSMHHEMAGGLVWHTDNVYRISMAMANEVERIYGAGIVSRPLLVAGSLLHDIGKVEEYTQNPESMGAEMSPDSIFEGHPLMGVRMIDRMAVRLGIEGTEEVKLLEHLVASHHENIEWGALTKPAIPEATIIARADYLDATMYRQAKKLKGLEPGKGQTEYMHGEWQGLYRQATKLEVGDMMKPAEPLQVPGVGVNI